MVEENVQRAQPARLHDQETFYTAAGITELSALSFQVPASARSSLSPGTAIATRQHNVSAAKPRLTRSPSALSWASVAATMELPVSDVLLALGFCSQLLRRNCFCIHHNPAAHCSLLALHLLAVLHLCSC